MKKNWERLRPHVEVGRADVERMLAPAFPGASVLAWERQSTGLANSNYRVTVARPGEEPEPALLRLYVRDPGAAGREAAIARRFAGVLPVPDVLFEGVAADPEGSGGAGAPGTWAGRYAVYRWAEGTLADRVVERGSADDATAVATACGAVLAAIQAQRFAAPGFFGPGPDLAVDPGRLAPGDYLDWMHSYLYGKGAAGALDEDSARRLWALVEAGAPLLAEVQDEASLVHCDFNGANILVRPHRGTWSVSAVLDWEFACSGSSLIDIGNMLRHFREAGAAYERPFVAGFRDAGGTLPTRWRQIADLYDLMSLCAFLVNPAAGEKVKADVTRLVRSTLARWG